MLFLCYYVILYMNKLVVCNMQDGYFDDESAEVVISSLRLGDDQGSLFTNSNWFAFQDNIEDDAPDSATSASTMLDVVNLNGTSNGGNSSSDDVGF